ncbi:MAG TPA: hypothetical protein VIL46_15555, partial [Gemmataceae bacterium]
MSAPEPPPCRHRGPAFAPGQYTCSSPKLVIPGGIVTAEVCRTHCPFVDHPDPVPRAPASGVGFRHTAPADLRPRAAARRPVAVRPRPERLAVAMITAPRAVRTVERSLTEVRRAGFGQTVYLFQEPGTGVAPRPGVELFTNPERLGVGE